MSKQQLQSIIIKLEQMAENQKDQLEHPTAANETVYAVTVAKLEIYTALSVIFREANNEKG